MLCISASRASKRSPASDSRLLLELSAWTCKMSAWTRKTACQLGLAKWCGTRPLLPELSARVFTGLSVWGPVWCGCFGVQCGAGALVWRPVWCGCVGVRCGAGAFACNCHPPPVISPRPHKAWVQLRTRALGLALSRPGRPHPARDADVARRPQNPGCPSYVHATGRVAPGREPGRHRG